jgi:hypothetical protein
MLLAQVRNSLARRFSSGITSPEKCRRTLLTTALCTLLFVILTPTIGALWLAIGILSMDMLYSTDALLWWYVKLFCLFLGCAAMAGIIATHAASRFFSIGLSTFVTFFVFVLADVHVIYSTPYSLIPSAGLYALHTIGYAAGALLLASVARICVELDEADWQPRRRLLVIGFGSMMFLAALYVFWLLPLPTHVALIASDWRTATVALQRDRLSRSSARIRFPALYHDSVVVWIEAKSLTMLGLLASDASHTVGLRTSRPQSVVICWPAWLQVKESDANLFNEDERVCLKETFKSDITIRGDILAMSASLKKAQGNQTDTMFVPIDSRVYLRREGDLIVEGPAGTTFSTEAKRLDELEFDIDRFGGTRYLIGDFMKNLKLDDLSEYKTKIAIEVDDKTLHF